VRDEDLRDRALLLPQDDLLGMREYASQLADHIDTMTPPLTIGVYGEWGSGKTSFVNLVKYYLGKKVEFIEFSAWRFRTADELWRALLLSIARRLYKVDRQGPGCSPEPAGRGSAGLLPSLAGFLNREALVLWEPPAVPDDRAEYRALLATIDDTFPAGIDKGPDARARLDPEAVLAAFAQIGFRAAEQAFPLVAGLRGLLGLRPEVDLPGLLRGRKAEATERRLRSIEDFQTAFKRLIEKKAEGRVCVFIDDLDRCMPDGSLDLLEAIRIFLGDVPAVFIVAADEQLIGQGLRLRLRDLVPAVGEEEAGTFLAAKGKEYFEKVFQMPVRVPPHSLEQSYTLVAAHFPAWRPAADIIRTAAGDNPRRLKQYGHLLAYRHSVWHILEKAGPAPVEQLLLEKLIELEAWCPTGLESLQQLALSGTAPADLRRLEDHLKAAGNNPPAGGEPPFADRGARTLLGLLAGKARPIDRLLADPRLSTATGGDLEVLVGIADLRPDPKGALVSQDVPFLRVLESRLDGQMISLWGVLMEDFTRLVAMSSLFPSLLDGLAEAAAGNRWVVQMQALEAAVRQAVGDGAARDGGPPLDEAAAAVLRAFEELRSQEPAGAAPPELAGERATQLRDLLLGAPLLYPPISTTLPAEVLGFKTVCGNLPPPESLLTKAVPVDSDEQKHRILAAYILENKVLPPDRWQAIERGLRLRIMLAEYFVGLRKFAKLDALEHRWPELAQLQRTDRDMFLGLETTYLQRAGAGGAGPPRLPKRLARYKDNEELDGFFSLRPYFKDIDLREVERYSRVAKAAVTTPAPPPPDREPVPGGTKAAAKASGVAAPSAPRPTAEATPRPGVKKPRRPARAERPAAVGAPGALSYKALELAVEPKEGGSDRYKVTLSGPGRAKPVTAEVAVRWEQFTGPARALDSAPRLDAPPVTRALSTLEPLAKVATILQRLGSALCDTFFPGAVGERLARQVARRRPFRLFLKLMNDPRLQTLPWECLYLAPFRLFPALTREYSLIRAGVDEVSRSPLPFDPPLRLLLVIPEPRDLPPLNGAQELAAVRQALEGRPGRDLVIKVLEKEQANVHDLQQVLRVFGPHLFHFIGHGHYDAQAREGRLVLQDGDSAKPIGAAALAEFLVNSTVQVALLNGCDTARGSRNDSLSSVGGALVDKGLPAVIATMREVPDEAAVRFSREFYRTLADGYPLEAAVAEARLALNAERWNWSAYALFCGRRDGLDALRMTSALIREGSA
jgi:hypothetical protein